MTSPRFPGTFSDNTRAPALFRKLFLLPPVISVGTFTTSVLATMAEEPPPSKLTASLAPTPNSSAANSSKVTPTLAAWRPSTTINNKVCLSTYPIALLGCLINRFLPKPSSADVTCIFPFFINTGPAPTACSGFQTSRLDASWGVGYFQRVPNSADPEDHTISGSPFTIPKAPRATSPVGPGATVLPSCTMRLTERLGAKYPPLIAKIPPCLRFVSKVVSLRVLLPIDRR